MLALPPYGHPDMPACGPWHRDGIRGLYHCPKPLTLWPVPAGIHPEGPLGAPVTGEGSRRSAHQRGSHFRQPQRSHERGGWGLAMGSRVLHGLVDPGVGGCEPTGKQAAL